MKNYSINKITNDVCQFIITFYKDTFARFFQFFDANFSLDKINSFNEVLNDEEQSNRLALVVLLQIRALSKYECCDIIKPQLKILAETKDEITIVITQAIYDEEIPELKYPLVDDLKIPELHETDKIYIDEVIKNNMKLRGFVEDISVDKGNLFDCDLYVKIFGKEKNLKDVIGELKFPDFYMDMEGITQYNVGQHIKVKNKLLKNGNIIYTISKIVEHRPLSLSDDVVQNLNYKNCKTSEELKRKLFNNMNEVKEFDNFIDAVIKRMVEINNIKVSKEFFKMYKSRFIFKTDDKDEEIYKILYEIKIKYFLEQEMKNINCYDTMLFENIIKLKYDLHYFEVPIDNISYEQYLEEHLHELKLYLHIKKQ